MIPVVLISLTVIAVIAFIICIKLIKKHREGSTAASHLNQIPSTPPSPGFLQQNTANLFPPPRLILTNQLNNNRAAVIVNGARVPQIPAGYKPFFDEPPPPYHSAILSPSPAGASPPPYDELDQLPGSILPSSSIQFHAPSLPRKQ